jgi:hypothetical protein
VKRLSGFLNDGFTAGLDSVQMTQTLNETVNPEWSRDTKRPFPVTPAGWKRCPTLVAARPRAASSGSAR